MDLKILNLGAGVQSASIYLLQSQGEMEPADYALFADTQDEPKWVYDQLEFLRGLSGPEIVEVSAGRIGDDLVNGVNSTGQRFASIPAHTSNGGLGRRQCTSEYKIQPIKRWIRREALGLKKGQRIPKGVRITNQFGFSTDEPQRAVRMMANVKKDGAAWECEFPLLHEDWLMTRQDCVNLLMEETGFEWRSSRCVFCPLQGNRHWLELKEHDPEGWSRAGKVDAAIREPNSICTKGMKFEQFVHKSCKPLKDANIDQGQSMLFEDDGGCDQGCFL